MAHLLSIQEWSNSPRNPIRHSIPDVQFHELFVLPYHSTIMWCWDSIHECQCRDWSWLHLSLQDGWNRGRGSRRLPNLRSIPHGLRRMASSMHIFANRNAGNSLRPRRPVGNQASTLGLAEIQLSEGRIGQESFANAPDGQDSYLVKEELGRYNSQHVDVWTLESKEHS